MSNFKPGQGHRTTVRKVSSRRGGRSFQAHCRLCGSVGADESRGVVEGYAADHEVANGAPEAVPVEVKHNVRWWVYTGGRNADGTMERIRRTSMMRGMWPGYDVECTCGWHTVTGGAVRKYIEDQVWLHKFQVENGTWDAEATV